MREEILNWLKQAKADLRKAEILFKEGEFDGVAFNSQQAVEKALKSLYMLKKKQGQKGHSIIYLAKQLKIPNKFMSGIRDLNPEYLVARYPDIAGGIPNELYDLEIATRHIKTAREVLKWVENQIKK